MTIKELPDTQQAIANSLSDQQQEAQPFQAQPTIANIPGLQTVTREPTEEEVDEHMAEVVQALTLPALTTGVQDDASPLSMSEEEDYTSSNDNTTITI